ncbi:MAG: acyl-CoA dehydrogenase C-terminal domain-containing protein, partial [Pseudomonadota bacterium]
GDATFYNAKIQTARFFMTKILPENSALFAKIMAGSKPLMALEEESF